VVKSILSCSAKAFWHLARNEMASALPDVEESMQEGDGIGLRPYSFYTVLWIAWGGLRQSVHMKS